jgi:hypothetical protein
MKTSLLGIVVSLISGLSTINTIGADDILQSQIGGALNLTGFAPIGQTFTATATKISVIGFNVLPANTIYPTTTFTYELREGAGTSGTVIATRSFNLPAGYTGYADADFSSVTLTVGQVYTGIIIVTNYDFAVYWNQWATEPAGVPIAGKVDYVGGQAIQSGQLKAYEDLTFHMLVPAAHQPVLIPLGISPANTDAAVGLSPANEAPAVLNSTGSGGPISGGLVFDTDTHALMLTVGYGSAAGFTDLTGPATSLTLNGPAGTNHNAGVLFDLAAFNFPAADPAQGGIIFGTVIVPTNAVPDLLAGLNYLNIGTATNTSGEIRGQLVSLLPAITCPEPMTVACGISVVPMVQVTNPTGNAFTVIWSVNRVTVQTNQVPAGNPLNPSVVVGVSAPIGALPLGTNLVEVTVTDSAGYTASCSTTVTVVDLYPPVIISLSASPNSLWPPNHKMVPVGVSATVSDDCGSVTWKIIGVQSNEPVNGLGDGDTAPDWQITGDNTVLLRAERSGKGNGRVYTLTLQAKDAAGNLSDPATVTVKVPKSQGKGK